jgi:hypothetical protein
VHRRTTAIRFFGISEKRGAILVPVYFAYA